MNQRQLANVLIKILGLSICIHAIPSFLFSVLTTIKYLSGPTEVRSLWVAPLTSLISVAIGVYLIAGSRKIAQTLFKNEDQ